MVHVQIVGDLVNGDGIFFKFQVGVGWVSEWSHFDVFGVALVEFVGLHQTEDDEAQAWHLPTQRAALAAEGVPALVMTRRDWLAHDGAREGISAFLQGICR